jgi:hypothetical protein
VKPPDEAGTSAQDAALEHSAGLGAPQQPVREVGGRPGPDPTRYGDWELRGRCIDF